MTRTRCPDPRCAACGHTASLHKHIRDGGCLGTCVTAYLGKLHSNYRCGCTRNPDAVTPELDDESDDVLARGEERDAQERREETT